MNKDYDRFLKADGTVDVTKCTVEKVKVDAEQGGVEVIIECSPWLSERKGAKNKSAKYYRMNLGHKDYIGLTEIAGRK